MINTNSGIAKYNINVHKSKDQKQERIYSSNQMMQPLNNNNNKLKIRNQRKVKFFEQDKPLQSQRRRKNKSKSFLNSGRVHRRMKTTNYGKKSQSMTQTYLDKLLNSKKNYYSDGSRRKRHNSNKNTRKEN